MVSVTMKDRHTKSQLCRDNFFQGYVVSPLCSSRSSWAVGLCQAANTGGKALDGARYGLGLAWVGTFNFQCELIHEHFQLSAENGHFQNNNFAALQGKEITLTIEAAF